MVLQGAEILFYPTAIGSEPQDEGLDSRDHWKRVMQGHAGSNLVSFVEHLIDTSMNRVYLFVSNFDIRRCISCSNMLVLIYRKPKSCLRDHEKRRNLDLFTFLTYMHSSNHSAV